MFQHRLSENWSKPKKWQVDFCHLLSSLLTGGKRTLLVANTGQVNFASYGDFGNSSSNNALNTVNNAVPQVAL